MGDFVNSDLLIGFWNDHASPASEKPIMRRSVETNISRFSWATELKDLT